MASRPDIRNIDAEFLKPKEVVFTMLPHQQKLVQSEAFASAVVGGIGSGKSHALGMCVFHWIKTQPNTSPIIALAPTYEQLDKATLARIKQMLNVADIDFVHGSRPPEAWDTPLASEFRKWTNVVTLESGHLIVCASLDNPSSIRGPEYGMALIDELAFCPHEDAFDVVLGRLRCHKTTAHKVRIATSPNGMNWFYDAFANPKKKREGYEIIKARSMDNPYNPDSYYEELSKYDDTKYQQEVMGEFVTLGSERVYTEFARERHIRPWKMLDSLPLHVGMDFNRSPLCWAIAQEPPGTNGKHVFDQILIESEATTYRACQLLREKYPDPVVYAYPDASCRHGNTASIGAASDLEILINAGFQVLCPPRNPPVQDRIESVQTAFREDDLFFTMDVEECIQSFTNTDYKPGTRQVKKSMANKVIGEHFTDAVGYMMHLNAMDTGVHEIAWT